MARVHACTKRGRENRVEAVGGRRMMLYRMQRFSSSEGGRTHLCCPITCDARAASRSCPAALPLDTSPALKWRRTSWLHAAILIAAAGDDDVSTAESPISRRQGFWKLRRRGPEAGSAVAVRGSPWTGIGGWGKTGGANASRVAGMRTTRLAEFSGASSQLCSLART